MSAQGRLLSAREAADYLGITVSRLRHFVRRGELESHRTDSGRLAGIYAAACDAWMAQHRRAAIKAAPPPVVPRHVAVDERMQHLMPREKVFG